MTLTGLYEDLKGLGGNGDGVLIGDGGQAGAGSGVGLSSDTKTPASLIFSLGMGGGLTGELGASSTASCSGLESLLLLESLEPELELLELELELLLELLDDLELADLLLAGDLLTLLR